jgi:hypothetical protein
MGNGYRRYRRTFAERVKDGFMTSWLVAFTFGAGLFAIVCIPFMGLYNKTSKPSK